MITRPLDLVSRLRPAPSNFDALFYVSAVMIGLQFALFGSRFVLSPGVPVEFQLPASASAGARPTTHHVAIKRGGLLITAEGEMSPERYAAWLKREAPITRDPSLLIQSDAGVEYGRIWELAEVARAAGFKVTIATLAPAAAATPAP